jgi:hypothetical protein
VFVTDAFQFALLLLVLLLDFFTFGTVAILSTQLYHTYNMPFKRTAPFGTTIKTTHLYIYTPNKEKKTLLLSKYLW